MLKGMDGDGRGRAWEEGWQGAELKSPREPQLRTPGSAEQDHGLQNVVWFGTKVKPACTGNVLFPGAICS